MKAIKKTNILKYLCLLLCFSFINSFFAQNINEQTTQIESNIQEEIQASPRPAPAPQPVVPAKPDALKLYREGRDFETIQKYSEARERFLKSAEVCRQELKENSRNIESYVVLGWSLIRLEQYKEVVTISNTALTISPKENRIIESLAEAYFYLDNYTESLKLFEQYVNALPNGDRASTAYFFVGDIYRLTQKYEHADIAYSIAIRKSPGIALWWYRLGMVRELAGKKAEAKVAYNKALEYRPIYQEASDALRRL